MKNKTNFLSVQFNREAYHLENE